MDKLPEYLRDTVDWFMGKARKRDRDAMGSENERKLYLQEPLLDLKISENEIHFLTDLPNDLDYNEWMASHTIGFFEHINLIYGTISEFCTPSSCPDMVGPGPRQYLWVDEKGKKSRLSAHQYIDYSMTYVQKTINDEATFPTKHGNDFPTGFDTQIRKIFRLLFHVLAHIYHCHFKEIVLLQLHAHLNAVFVHFVEFSLKFQIVEEKELEVLDDLIDALKIVTPNSKSTDENKENIQDQERGSSKSIPMDVSESSASQADTSTKGESGPNPNAAEAEMDVDCSISEND